MRIVFMGTPVFSVPILDALISRHDVLAVYCQPPRPSGRGQKERPCPVQTRAETLGLTVRTPGTLRSEAEFSAFRALCADLAVVAAYGLILPQAVLDAPRWGCMNVHASLLPRWRGAAPIQRAIMSGDTETGVTIMRMEAGLDTGPMLLKQAIPIGETETSDTLHDALSQLGATMILAAIDSLADGTLAALAQPAHGVTYAEKIDKAEAVIDWSRPAYEVARHINGLSPFPGAWFQYRGQRMKVLRAVAEVINAEGAASGQLLDDRLLVACGKNAVRLLTLQRSGKSVMECDSFLHGAAAHFKAGLVLG